MAGVSVNALGKTEASFPRTVLLCLNSYQDGRGAQRMTCNYSGAASRFRIHYFVQAISEIREHMS